MVLTVEQFKDKYSAYSLDQMMINKEPFINFINDYNDIRHEIIRKSISASNENANELFRAVCNFEITVEEYKTKLNEFDKKCHEWRDSELSKLELTRTKIERSW